MFGAHRLDAWLDQDRVLQEEFSEMPSPQGRRLSSCSEAWLYGLVEGSFGMVGFGMVGFGMRLLSWPICGC